MKTLLNTPLIRALAVINLLVVVLLGGRVILSRWNEVQARRQEDRAIYAKSEHMGLMSKDNLERLFQIQVSTKKARAFSDADLDFLVDQLSERPPNATDDSDCTRQTLVLFTLGMGGSKLTDRQRTVVVPALRRVLVYRSGSGPRSVLSVATRLAGRMKESSLAPSLQALRGSGDPVLKRAAEATLAKIGAP